MTGLTPNVAHLAGKRCPKCGSYGPFMVEVKTLITVSDESMPEVGTVGLEPALSSYTICVECKAEADWQEFDDPAERGTSAREEEDKLEDVPAQGQQLVLPGPDECQDAECGVCHVCQKNHLTSEHGEVMQ